MEQQGLPPLILTFIRRITPLVHLGGGGRGSRLTSARQGPCPEGRASPRGAARFRQRPSVPWRRPGWRGGPGPLLTAGRLPAEQALPAGGGDQLLPRPDQVQDLPHRALHPGVREEHQEVQVGLRDPRHPGAPSPLPSAGTAGTWAPSLPTPSVRPAEGRPAGQADTALTNSNGDSDTRRTCPRG